MHGGSVILLPRLNWSWAVKVATTIRSGRLQFCRAAVPYPLSVTVSYSTMIHNTNLTLKCTNTRNGFGHSAVLAWLLPRENSLLSLPTTVYPLDGFTYTPMLSIWPRHERYWWWYNMLLYQALPTFNDHVYSECCNLVLAKGNIVPEVKSYVDGYRCPIIGKMGI